MAKFAGRDENCVVTFFGCECAHCHRFRNGGEDENIHRGMLKFSVLLEEF